MAFTREIEGFESQMVRTMRAEQELNQLVAGKRGKRAGIDKR